MYERPSEISIFRCRGCSGLVAVSASSPLTAGRFADSLNESRSAAVVQDRVTIVLSDRFANDFAGNRSTVTSASLHRESMFLSGSAPPGSDNSIAASERPYLGRVHAQGVNHDNQATLPTADVVGGSCRGIDRHRTRRAGRTILHLSQRQQHRLPDTGKCADRHLAAPGPVQPAVPVLRWRLARLPPWRTSLGKPAAGQLG